MNLGDALIEDHLLKVLFVRDRELLVSAPILLGKTYISVE